MLSDVFIRVFLSYYILLWCGNTTYIFGEFSNRAPILRNADQQIDPGVVNFITLCVYLYFLINYLINKVINVVKLESIKR